MIQKRGGGGGFLHALVACVDGTGMMCDIRPSKRSVYSMSLVYSGVRLWRSSLFVLKVHRGVVVVIAYCHGASCDNFEQQFRTTRGHKSSNKHVGETRQNRDRSNELEAPAFDKARPGVYRVSLADCCKVEVRL